MSFSLQHLTLTRQARPGQRAAACQVPRLPPTAWGRRVPFTSCSLGTRARDPSPLKGDSTESLVSSFGPGRGGVLRSGRPLLSWKLCSLGLRARLGWGWGAASGRHRVPPHILHRPWGREGNSKTRCPGVSAGRVALRPPGLPQPPGGPPGFAGVPAPALKDNRGEPLLVTVSHQPRPCDTSKCGMNQ